ncbi:MAG: hypothetical protein HYS27_21810 [Deltaproteobacteria bacterium]|nr:hypothetical protein [Deltaproteobacteria bacterium]
MSDADRPVAQAEPQLEDAVEAALGALVRDRDVTEVHCLEGGMLHVVRRGRRERLDAVLEGPLFGLVRDAGAERALITRRLRGGHRLVAGACADGRLAVRVAKAPTLDAELVALVDEQLLPPGLPDELVAAAAMGGLLVLGPARAGRQRVACAVARAAQRTLAFASVVDATEQLFPAPTAADVVARVRAADALGFDALFALELDADECARLVRAPLTLPLVASVRAASVEALTQALGGAPIGALATLACVIGLGPDGRPRLLEVHGSVEGGTHGEATADAPAEAPRARAARSHADATADDELPPLAALPSAWASTAPDVDPGWELAGLPDDATAAGPSGPPLPTAPTAGSFDAALARQAARPSFQPRAPKPHPQASTLKGNPFGGLTFEPPQAPPGSDAPGSDAPDGGTGGGDPDEEPR